jgi:hypothetical protein
MDELYKESLQKSRQMDENRRKTYTRNLYLIRRVIANNLAAHMKRMLADGKIMTKLQYKFCNLICIYLNSLFATCTDEELDGIAIDYRYLSIGTGIYKAVLNSLERMN